MTVNETNKKNEQESYKPPSKTPEQKNEKPKFSFIKKKPVLNQNTQINNEEKTNIEQNNSNNSDSNKLISTTQNNENNNNIQKNNEKEKEKENIHQEHPKKNFGFIRKGNNESKNEKK